MAQHIDHATYQLYENYHTQVHVLRDTHTYDHFSAGRTSGMRQAELLPTYLQEMIRCLLSDLNTRGDCWLLRAIVSRELPSIHLLDQSAIAYVYSTLFTPDETPQLDTRSIPYSSDYSRSVGGMLYSDPHAKTCVLDLRSSSDLHLLCHALLMYAAHRATQDSLSRLSEEKAALNSRITQLSDRILGLEHDLAAARKALAEAAPAEPVTSPAQPSISEAIPASDPAAPAAEPVAPEASEPTCVAADEEQVSVPIPSDTFEAGTTPDTTAPALEPASSGTPVDAVAVSATTPEDAPSEATDASAPDDASEEEEEPKVSGRVYKRIPLMHMLLL